MPATCCVCVRTRVCVCLQHGRARMLTVCVRVCMVEERKCVCVCTCASDDHDFGWNNGNGRLPHKDQFKDLFLDAIGEPRDSPRRAKTRGLHVRTHTLYTRTHIHPHAKPCMSTKVCSLACYTPYAHSHTHTHRTNMSRGSFTAEAWACMHRATTGRRLPYGQRACVCVCVCVCGRERESVCACVCLCVRRALMYLTRVYRVRRYRSSC